MTITSSTSGTVSRLIQEQYKIAFSHCSNQEVQEKPSWGQTRHQKSFFHIPLYILGQKNISNLICSHLTKGMPEGTRLAYSMYWDPKNCLRKYSSYGIRLEKNRQVTRAKATTQTGLQSITWVPTAHMKNPVYPGCRKNL